MQSKRIHIITGHYGSGKTNFSINYAIGLARKGHKVCLVDLDVVNPYFCAAEMRDLLEREGIAMVAPLYTGTNLDIPALSPKIEGVLREDAVQSIIDVGGDDAGAAALGRFSDVILKQNDHLHLNVINARRALTRSPEEAVAILREIEHSCRIPADALVNNTNLGDETGADIILDSLPYAERVSQLTGLPVFCTAVPEALLPQLAEKVPHVCPIKIYVRKPWET